MQCKCGAARGGGRTFEYRAKVTWFEDFICRNEDPKCLRVVQQIRDKNRLSVLAVILLANATTQLSA